LFVYKWEKKRHVYGWSKEKVACTSRKSPAGRSTKERRRHKEGREKGTETKDKHFCHNRPEPSNEFHKKLKTQFKKGDVGFMASNSSICFFLEDVSAAKSMTLIGKITSNLDAIKEVKPGDIFSIIQAGT